MMVAAAAAISTTNPRLPKPPSSRRAAAGDQTRTPLSPSDSPNAAIPRKPKPPAKEVSSRYRPSNSPKPTPAASSSTSKRYPSPSPASNPRPSTPKRSQSVDRTRPTATSDVTSPSAAKALLTTTRSLSVSFQGESFVFQASKIKPIPPKPTSDRRKPISSSNPSSNSNSTAATPVKNAAPDHGRRWPAAKARQLSSLSRSLDCSAERNRSDSVLAAVRLLRQSMAFEEEPKRASFDGDEMLLFSPSSDTSDSVSSGSNSELGIRPRVKASPQGISVPARFWQEANNGRQQPGTPLAPSKLFTPKKAVVDSHIGSPRAAASPLRGGGRAASPSRGVAASPARPMSSPFRGRSSSTVSSTPVSKPSNVASSISFGGEVRRVKKGESRIDEAHLLRMLYNRYLQWRCVNAQADAVFLAQTMTAEKNLFDAWITVSDLRDSVTIKRVKLQHLKHQLKLTSILKEQMAYLEDWFHMDGDHVNSLAGAIAALKASTLRLPVVGGAQADIHEVQNAVGSAVDVMQAMGTSICSLVSKVQGTSSLASELAKAAADERTLLNQSRDLLSMVAAMHVKQCSLQGHILQLRRKSDLL